MRCQTPLVIILIIILLASVPVVPAFETDQYNLSPEPLADIGDEFADHVREQIRFAIYMLNAESARHQACLSGTAGKEIKCGSMEKETRKLAEIRSPDTVAAAVYEQLGKGTIFTSTTGKWLKGHKFAHEPSRYKTSYADSIFVTAPINYATISPTMRMYGSEFGTDKMDHFFQQGYKYFQMYRKAIAKGKTPEQATAEVVKWGQKTERLFFGMLVSGVYSNADLFANYAGMKFFLRLTGPVDLADGTRLYPVLTLTDGQQCAFYDERSDNRELIGQFISDHLNEALNPSGFSFILYPTVKRVVRKQACPEWRRIYPAGTSAEFEQRSAALEKWHGEDYGFTRKSRTVRISSCFEEDDKAN